MMASVRYYILHNHIKINDFFMVNTFRTDKPRFYKTIKVHRHKHSRLPGSVNKRCTRHVHINYVIYESKL